MDFTAIARIAQREHEDVVIEILSTDDLPGAVTPAGPVATITSVMRPGGPDPDPFISPEHRITYLLREIGWAPTGTVRIGSPFGVVRETRFRATVNHEGSSIDSVQVRNDDGELLVEAPVVGSPDDVLSGLGWRVLGAAGGGWPDDVLAIAPGDWKVVVERARADREIAQREAARRDSRWSACVREAILDGRTAKELAEVAGVSVQRIYQIRDRRR